MKHNNIRLKTECAVRREKGPTAHFWIFYFVGSCDQRPKRRSARIKAAPLTNTTPAKPSTNRPLLS